MPALKAQRAIQNISDTQERDELFYCFNFDYIKLLKVKKSCLTEKD
jgi:hypothetical protein